MKIENIAQVVYETNAAYAKSLGDNSFKPWTQSPQWQKDTILKGIEFIKNNPNASPSASHDSWLEEKRRTGWKYGPVKDELKKEHPCFVEYDKLPVEQKAKDYIFGAIVRTLLPHLNKIPSAQELEKAKEDANTIRVPENQVTAKEPLSLDQKAAAATTYSNDGRRTVDLSKVTAN